MAINVSGVVGYVQANEKELIGASVLKGKTASVIGLQTGVKGSSQLNILNCTPVLQNGGCGWSASGTTALTKRIIKSGLIKVNDSFCEKDLIGTFAEMELKIAAGTQTLPFEQAFVEQIVKGVQKQNELTIWRGDVTGATYNRFDGFIKILEAEATVVDATIVGKTLAANTIDAVNAIVAKIPDEILDRDDLVIFVSNGVFRNYVAAMQAVNSYNYFPVLDGKTMELIIPGTSIKLIGVGGLDATHAYASYAPNFRLGTDMEGDSEKFEFWYSQDNREYRIAMDYNLGVQVAFPNMVVKYIA